MKLTEKEMVFLVLLYFHAQCKFVSQLDVASQSQIGTYISNFIALKALEASKQRKI